MTFRMYCRSVETREWYITHFGLTLQQDKSFQMIRLRTCTKHNMRTQQQNLTIFVQAQTLRRHII